MTVKSYNLIHEDEQRLIKGLEAAVSIPLLDSIEDFVWESIFCYMKNIPLADPFNSIRSKKLYDIVDHANHIGWSAKALQFALKPESEFELVVQRADIFSKADELGFPGLNLDSAPDLLGKALLKHWKNKIYNDAISQNIIDKRVCILLKNKSCSKFSYVEEDIAIYDDDELRWEWTDSKKKGLKGIRKTDNFCVYKWYHGQTQFFERFKLGSHNKIYDIHVKRFNINDFIDLLNSRLKE